MTDTHSIPIHRPLTPAETGQLWDDRAKLLAQIEAIEAGFADGTATDAWRKLLTTARWMRLRDAGETKP